MAYNSEYMSNILRMLKKSAVRLTIAAISFIAAYIVCESRHREEETALRKEIKRLTVIAEESKVTLRISEQMEDIAFEQKAISDKQRERAETQSRIAGEEREKAERERMMAQTAELNARIYAEQADSMRKVAERQTFLATSNMNAAEAARAHADTLFYLSLGSSLAKSSMYQSSEIKDIKQLLAYASWYITKKYGGDTDEQYVYSALLHSSGNVTRINTLLKGNVRSINLVTIHGGKCVLGITDNGEVFCYDDNGRREVSYIKGYIVRDMAVTGSSTCVIMSTTGQLLLCDYSDVTTSGLRILKIANLAYGSWQKLVMTPDGNRLVAMSRNTVAWIDTHSMETLKSYTSKKQLTALGLYDKGLLLFTQDGSTLSADSKGEVTVSTLFKVEDFVVAYYYDPVKRLHILGHYDGTVDIYDSGNKVAELKGHTGPVTHISTAGDKVITTSYDHTIRFWNTKDINDITFSFRSEFGRWPLTFTIDGSNSVIWVGNEGGNVNRFCYSVEKNAVSTHRLLKREFTDAEWRHFAGQRVPRMNFLNANTSDL